MSPGRDSGAVRVVVVDDEPLVRTGLKAVLAASGEVAVVGEAGDGEDAVAVVRRTAPDVVLLDVRMPRVDGIEATRRVRRLPVPPAVVLLTAFDLDRHVVEGLAAGAAGFLLKDAPEEQLLAAVRAARDGVSLLDARVTLRLLDRWSAVRPAAPGGATVPPALDRLTPREEVLLRELASGESNAEIAGRLHISEATVKTHVSRILAKLGLSTRVQAVVLAYEAGLVGGRAGGPR